MQGKFVVKQIAPGVWSLSHFTSIGASTGRTTYPTSADAVQAAKTRDPHAEIEIQQTPR